MVSYPCKNISHCYTKRVKENVKKENLDFIYKNILGHFWRIQYVYTSI